MEDLEFRIKKPSSSEPILVSSKKGSLNTQLSISNQASFEPSLGCNAMSSLKSNATGFFPTGSLSSKKKGTPKSLNDSNNISAIKLMMQGLVGD